MAELHLGEIPRRQGGLGAWVSAQISGRRYLTLDDRQLRLHRHVLGLAGSGKSKLLEGMFLQTFRQGVATSFVDPHGSSAEAILQALIGLGYFSRTERPFERLLYVEFSDGEYFLPFNPLKLAFATEYERVKLVIESFKRVWVELQQAAMFDTLMDAALKCLIANDGSLVALHDVLKVKSFRDDLLLSVSDPLLHSFWRNTWDRLPDRDQIIMGGAAIRRAYLIVSSPITRNCFGQAENVLDFRRILDEGVSVLVNLGYVKDAETRRLLMAMIVHGYEVAALSRLPRTDLPQHQLIIDEMSQAIAQSSDALAAMLDQTRKAGLFLTLAHQTWSQTNVRLTGALQNAMIKVSFRVGAEDAPIQAKALADIDLQAIRREAASPTGNPIMASVQDQYAAWERALKTLAPRHALVRIETEPAQEIVTLEVPNHDVGEGEVQNIKDEYFRRYYHRREDVKLPFQQGGGTATQTIRE